MNTELQGTYELHGVKLPAVMEVDGQPRTVLCVDDDGDVRYFENDLWIIESCSPEDVRPLKTERAYFRTSE